MSGKLQRRMASCPSFVPGALTRIELTADGADVVVTASTEAAERRIAALADFHQRTPSPVGPMAHTGLRGGNARIGYCPILHQGVKITTARVPGGVRIHLRSELPGGVKDLQGAVSARAERLPGFTSS
jgi:hypothetical protein